MDIRILSKNLIVCFLITIVNTVMLIHTYVQKAYSASGNHCITIIKEPESYVSLKSALEDIINEVETLKIISINDNTYSIEYYLGEDWKFLTIVTWIDSTSCEYACIWCKCPALECHITDERWSIFNIKYGAHSIEKT